MRLLLHALLFSGLLGALHLAMARRGTVPPIPFCAAGALAHVLLGLLLLAPALAGQIGRAWTTAFWAPAFGLGLFVTGAVLAGAWLATVRGLEWAIRTRGGRSG